MIEPALTAGFIAMGMDVVLVGPLPTPAIAMLTRSLARRSRRHDLGLAQSLSRTTASSCSVPTATSSPTRSSRRSRRRSTTAPAARAAAAAARAAPGGSTTPAGATSSSSKSSFPRGLRLDGAQDRDRLRATAPPTSGADGAVGARRRGRADRRRARRLQHQPRLRRHRAGPRCAQEVVRARRRSRHRARRRRRPRSSWWTSAGRVLDGDQLMALIALRTGGRAGRLAGERRGRDRDVESRLRALPRGARHSA